MKRELIILTKSQKYREHYCIAGIDTRTGKWIRLVSDDQKTEGAVPKKQLQLLSGDDLKIYDIVSCEILGPSATLIQPENWLYDKTKQWEKVGESNLKQVLRIHDCNTSNYIFENEKNYLPENWKFTGKPSLHLAKIQNIFINVKTFEKQKISLLFTYRGVNYKFMRITQTEVKEYYKEKADGTYPIKSDRVAVFSLTNKFNYNGKCYKLVAQLLK